MLYLYRNGLDTYQVIDEVQNKEILLFETKNIDEGILFFENEIKNRKKTTIMRFDGSEIKDWRNK